MTLVLENLPPTVTQALEKRAQEEGRALQDVAIDALQRGLAQPAARDLSDIAGTWVEDPAFDQAVAEFERVDSDLWK